MKRQIVITLLPGIFFIVIACFGIKTFSLSPAAPPSASVTETLAHQSNHSPDAELEGTHFHFTTAGHTLLQKNLVPLYLSPGIIRSDAGIAVENSKIKRSSLLIKDYLSHIYPSHNFW